MNSTIRLYYGNAERPWELFEERNFIIEDIADYLKQYPYLERQDFMHQKLHLDMSIKVDIGQEYMNPLYETAIRYVSITPDEEDKTYYFYVEECNWLSRKAVQLSIHMDTLNTFKYNSYENGYILSGGTHITRQHKDRIGINIGLVGKTANQFVYYYYNEDNSVIHNVSNTLTNNLQGYLTTSTTTITGRINANYETIITDQTGKEYIGKSGTIECIGTTSYSGGTYTFNCTTIIIHITLTEPLSYEDALKFCDKQYFQYNFHFTFYYPGTTNVLGSWGYTADSVYAHIIVSVDQYLTYGNAFQRYIDYYPEQLDIPVYLSNTEPLIDDFIDENWYLIIANQNNPDESAENPVNYLLCCDKNIEVSGLEISGNTFEITPDDIPDGETWYLWFGSKADAIYLLLDEWATSLEEYALTSSTTDTQFTIKNENGVLKLNFSYKTASKTTILASLSKDKLEWTEPLEIYYSTTKNGTRRLWTKTTSGYIPTGETATLSSFADIDRTDSKLIKIFLLPYRPCNMSEQYSESTGYNFVFTFSTEDYELYKYSNVNNELQLLRVKTDDLTANIGTSSIDPRSNTLLEIEDLRKTDLFSVDIGSKSYSLESKMYNSDFYYQKLVYDSFNYSYHLETIEPVDDTTLLRFDFTMTKTGNSRFMFTYDVTWKFSEMDYPNVMEVSRNNEMPLFNNAYLDYVRTGYNYDVKNKTLHNTMDWVSLFTSSSRGIASTGEMGNWGGNLHGVQAQQNIAYNSFYQGAVSKGVSTVINAVGGAINNALQMQIRANNLEKTVTEKQWQTSSIYGSDDVDLLMKYTNNRMSMLTYEINEQFKKLVLALFHFTGYKCNEFGVPDVSTRTRFNYVQADIVLDSMMNFSSEIKQELIGRWAGGVYFIHHYNNEWDCQLKYENYEVSLEEYIS